MKWDRAQGDRSGLKAAAQIPFRFQLLTLVREHVHLWSFLNVKSCQDNH